MPEFTKLVAKHQHDLIDAELQRIMGPFECKKPHPLLPTENSTSGPEYHKAGNAYIYQVVLLCPF